MQIKIWEDFFLCFYQHSYTQILQRCLWTCICMSMVSHLWCYSLDITQMVSSQHLISLSQVITWPPDPLQSELCFPMNLSLLLCSPCSSDLQEHFGCARAMTASLPQHCQQESWMQPWAIWFPEEKRTLPEKRKLKAKNKAQGDASPGNHHSRHAQALEEGQVRKANGPCCLGDATEPWRIYCSKLTKIASRGRAMASFLVQKVKNMLY